MARTVNGTNQYLSRTNPLSGFPFTLAGWFRATDATTDRAIVCLYQPGSSNYIYLGLLGAQAGDPCAVDFYPNSGAGRAATSTGYSANTWHHVAIRASSASSWAAFIDGGSKGTSTASYTGTFANLSTLAVGRLEAFGGTYYAQGWIGDLALWNVALDDSEIAAMGSGLRTADQVRPSALVAQWPLGGLRPDNDRDQWAKAYDLTATNSPGSADHPRLWYPSEPQIINVATSTTKYWLFANRNAAIIG